MENSQNTVVMPAELTAANGAKAALMGEFHIEVRHSCSFCDGSGEVDDGDCETCEGDGEVVEQRPIPWDTIKDIYRKAVEVCGQPSAPAQAEPATVTDDEIVILAADFKEEKYSCGIHYDELDTVGFARALLAKAAPAQAEPSTKDWPEDRQHENGYYQCACAYCDDLFMGHKRRQVCKVCAVDVAALGNRS